MRIKQLPLKASLAIAITTAIMPIAHSAEIEKIQITAQKRTQSINEVGVTTTAFSGDMLSEMGIKSAVDLGANTPGLVTVNSTSGGTPIFAIRGIGLDDFSANNTSGVGVYTDEIFASSPVYLGGQLFDIERVEVLKGPQGTLYGKNTTGGAINFITKKPTDDFEAFFEADFSSYKTLELTSAVSGALSDTVNGRLSVNYVKSNEGWQEDINTGEEFGLQDRFSIRGQLGFELGDDGTGLLRIYTGQDKSKPLSPHGEGVDLADATSFIEGVEVLNSPTDPEKVTVGNLDVSRDESGSGISLTLDYSFENFDVISISSADQYDRVVIDNIDGVAAAITDLSQDNQLEQWAQEVRFISTGNDDFTWVAGFNISNELVIVHDSFDDSFLVSDSSFNEVFDPADANFRGQDVLLGDYEQETDSYGVYLHTETQLNEEWKLIAGIRYSKDKRSFNGEATNISFGDVFPITSLDESHKDGAITGKLGLDWKVNKDLLVFGNIATSYKSGVYYGAGVVDATAWSYVDPEDVTSAEIGFKWTLLEGAMQLNGAAFTLEYENRQSFIAYTTDDFSNEFGYAIPETTLINIPESESTGFEMDILWLPTDELTLSGGFSYLDSKVTQAPTAADMRGISPNTSANDQAAEDGAGFVDALLAPINKGTTLSQAPELSYNALISYHMPLESGHFLKFQTSYNWSDSQFGVLADSNAEIGETSSLNALVSFTSAYENWVITAWARNVLNNDAETYSFSGFAGRTVYRQQPATFGLTFSYSYY